MKTNKRSNDHLTSYDNQAADLCSRYDAVDMRPARELVLSWLGLPPQGRSALDVGAGSGRDARWLASLGYQVTAIEPSSGMSGIGKSHPDNGSIRWIEGHLPALPAFTAAQFNLVLCWAVWQHIAPADRDHAFESLLAALKPSCDLIMMIRIGAAPLDRPMYSVEQDEILHQCRQLGLPDPQSSPLPDMIGRPDCTWTAYHIKL